MKDAIYSKKLIAGNKTYFFDIREGKEGDRYLQISETRLDKNNERIKNNIAIFKNRIKMFRQALGEVIEKI